MCKYKVMYYDHGAFFVDQGLVDGSQEEAVRYITECFNLRPELLMSEIELEELDHVLIKNRITELFR